MYDFGAFSVSVSKFCETFLKDFVIALLFHVFYGIMTAKAVMIPEYIVLDSKKGR